LKKTLKVLLVLLGVIVLAGFKAMQPKEPEYQGRKLSEWVQFIGHDKTKQQNTEALAALRAMGPNLFPPLIDQLCDKIPKWKWWLSEIAWEHGMDPFDNFGGNPVQINAYGAFLALKKDAYPAIPMLVQRLEIEDEVGANYIFMVLENMGNAAVPELNKALASESPVLKNRATTALAVIGKTFDP